MHYKNLEELRDKVENSGDVLSVTMLELRNAYGAQRLGTVVRENISADLAGLGIGTFPDELPDYQEEHVRVYKRGSAAATLIEAVLEPNPKSDERIRAAARKEGEEVLRRIRELVCG